MEIVLGIILIVFFVYFIFSMSIIEKWHKLQKTKDEVERRTSLSGFEFWTYLTSTQRKYGVPERYCLNEQMEKTVAIKILDYYKEVIFASYFNGNFRGESLKGDCKYIDRFMLPFFNFFYAESSVNSIHSIYHDIYRIVEDFEHLEKKGDIPCSSRSDLELYDIHDYRDKEFKLIYYKMYYIAYTYCKNSPISNPSLFPNWKDYVEKYLISELEKRTS